MGASKTVETVMTQYLVAIHLPDDFDPAIHSNPEMEADIDALNQDMIAAGVRQFAGGLRPPREARTIRAAGAGKLALTDGPFMEAKEHVGGFWILDCKSAEEALEWGRKAVVACRAPVEVRAFY